MIPEGTFLVGVEKITDISHCPEFITRFFTSMKSKLRDDFKTKHLKYEEKYGEGAKWTTVLFQELTNPY
jgi:hypothetical protein